MRSRRMKIAMAGVAIAILATAGGWYISQDRVTLKPAASTCVPLNPVPNKMPIPEDLSKRFADWKNWDLRKRLDEVTALGGRTLPKDVVELLHKEVQIRDIGQHLRNNMSEALLANASPEMQLTQLYYTMMHDQAEAENWRLYALQFFARSAKCASSKDKVFITEELMRMAQNENQTVAGTAIDMMVFITHYEKLVVVPDAFIKDLYQILTSHEKPVSLQVVAQEALRKYQYAQALPEYRKNAANGAVMLQLSALAALGDMGSAVDRETIKRSLKNPDPRVVKAATAALVAYDRRVSAFEKKGTPASNFARHAVESQQVATKNNSLVLKKFLQAQNARHERKEVRMPRNQ